MASSRTARTRSQVHNLIQDENVDPKKALSSSRADTKSRTTLPLISSIDIPSASSLKRKYVSEEKQPADSSSSPQNGPPKKKQKEDAEKRLRQFRKQAPKSFLEKLDRAKTQRMIVVGRSRSGDGDSLQEDIGIVGSTGNIYKVTIGQLPSCTCPDSTKGNECKHKVYALHTVLKAPEHLQYQRAFLKDELQEIFAQAPPIPTDVGDAEDKDGKRKPVEGECPICYMDFDEENNELVWCKAACGNNMHKSCFDQWATSQRGKTVKCVYCRTDWQRDGGSLQDIQQTGSITEEGYVNVAEQFGLPRERDMSSYNQYWVRRTYGRNYGYY